jgi:hypothetical protein
MRLLSAHGIFLTPAKRIMMTSASLKWCGNANQRAKDEGRNKSEVESLLELVRVEVASGFNLEFVVETMLLPACGTGKSIQTTV